MKRTILLLTLLICIKLSAQETIPKLTGKVEISIKQGTIEADLTLSDIPRIKDYFIRINSGLNILHFKSIKPNDFLLGYSVAHNDTLTYGESKAYFFPDDTRKGKFLPNEIQVKYVGKYPVVKDTLDNYAKYDWKGNIAFNHNSVRADGFQSAWYPVLYDITNDKTYENVKYDIQINCQDCSTLYINGNKPVQAQKHKFKSEIARELTIFCGNFDFSKVEDTYILNPSLTNEQITDFSNLINSYKKFYTNKLNIPFEQAVTFIETTPTSKKNGWMFVSYPSIYSIGWGENGLISLFNPKIQNWYRPFIAHELGHYYFGTYKVFNSELGDMMSEGFSEFLSFELTKSIIGKDVYNKKISDKIKTLKNFTPKPMGKIKGESEYENREFYVYYYAPIIFTAIKNEIGEDKMWEWLNTILTTETNFTNYDFLISTLQRTVNDQKLIDLIEDQYLTNDNSLKNAIEKITIE
tara:strand:+ start:71 stop:1468 length:1398 start_codon:yes stop_codon:yes gene_type:complete